MATYNILVVNNAPGCNDTTVTEQVDTSVCATYIVRLASNSNALGPFSIYVNSSFFGSGYTRTDMFNGVVIPLGCATPTPTPSPTPTSAAVTPTQTPSNTETVTPTPSVTSTLTPTTTPTLTVCPETNNCMEITVTGATEEFFPSIQYNNCYGTLINESFTTNGTRYRCVQFVMGVAQIISYTGMPEPTIFGGNCNSFECPGGVVPLTPTPTPTVTQTQTPSSTIGATPSNTQTQTVTPTNTNTQTNTQTNTPTPSITPSGSIETCAFLTVRSDASLDVPITGVEVNSVPVTYLSGTTFTINPSDAPGYFNTTQTGASETVTVTYGSNIAGQRIELVDCDAVTHCCDLNPGGGTCTFTGVNLGSNCNWEIQAYDGSCI
jgi:hypothetical protein